MSRCRSLQMFSRRNTCARGLSHAACGLWHQARASRWSCYTQRVQVTQSPAFPGGCSMAMDAKQIWQSALEKLRLRISPAAYATWCNGTSGQTVQGNQLTVSVPTTFASEHLRQRFQEQARIAVSEVMGQRAEVVFVVRPVEAAPALPRKAPPTRLARAGDARRPLTRSTQPALAHEPHQQPLRSGRHAAQPQVAQPPLPFPSRAPEAHPAPETREAAHPQKPLSTGKGKRNTTANAYTPHDDLHPRYLFETFISGAANQLAYAAAREVAYHPGEQYNPLLIYGGSGLGKTHLLHAIGHAIHRRGLSVAYVTAERFTNEIIEAIRQRTTDAFRARYRLVDVLLVDDVQFIAGKESTEEEFFHTFNTLHEANKQIVLSSDRVPHAMSHLHDRLRSRFAWGLIADIHAPDFEHRLAILRAKAAALPVPIPEEVLLCVARPECESIRVLEGSLNRLVASAQMLGQPLDARLVGRLLEPLANGPEQQTHTPGDVIAAVARHFGVTVAALEGASRERGVAWARQVAMYLLREETPYSLLQIGQELGGRDHTTVLHGCQRVSKALAQDDLARADLASIRAMLK